MHQPHPVDTVAWPSPPYCTFTHTTWDVLRQRSCTPAAAWRFVLCICRFFQNQIRSEEEFQANKAQLREQARATLEHLFDKKGKHLVIDSDDDFSICSSELSAWDSDVDSISSMVSCAADWVQETQFQAPALQQLRAVMLLTLVSHPLLLSTADTLC